MCRLAVGPRRARPVEALAVERFAAWFQRHALLRRGWRSVRSRRHLLLNDEGFEVGTDRKSALGLGEPVFDIEVGTS